MRDAAETIVDPAQAVAWITEWNASRVHHSGACSVSGSRSLLAHQWAISLKPTHLWGGTQQRLSQGFAQGDTINNEPLHLFLTYLKQFF